MSLLIFTGFEYVMLFIWLVVLIFSIVLVNRDVMHSDFWMTIVVGAFLAFVMVFYNFTLLHQVMAFVVVSMMIYLIKKIRNK